MFHSALKWYFFLASGEDNSVIKGPWSLPMTYAAKVTVKRVFRGDKKRFEARTVILEGLGNPKICVSRPKIGDTRIFFGDEIQFNEFNFPAENLPHLRLRSSILRLTLENLRYLWNDQNHDATKPGRTNATRNSGRSFKVSFCCASSISNISPICYKN